MKSKKSKKLSQAKLLKKYEPKMKVLIMRRDNGKCQIAGYRHICSASLCVDHRPAKRGKHATFFDPRNLTTVCCTANMLAEFDPFISLRIMEVVKEREGVGTIELLERKSREIKKWSAEEIEQWIEKCKYYFQFHTRGCPDDR